MVRILALRLASLLGARLLFGNVAAQQFQKSLLLSSDIPLSFTAVTGRSAVGTVLGPTCVAQQLQNQSHRRNRRLSTFRQDRHPKMKLTRFGEWILPTSATDDPLAPYRDRATYLIATVGIVFLVPFAIYDLAQGRLVLGGLIVFLILVLSVDSVAFIRNRPPPIAASMFLFPALAAIGIAIKVVGIAAVFWLFPGVLFLYFALPRRAANASALAALAFGSVLIFYFENAAVTARFSATLLATIVISNIILNIIQDLQRQLIELAITDPLTGALNRRNLDSQLDEAIERNRRQPTPAALLLIDIDNFKRVNDDLGHEAGDKVLKDVVAFINARARKLDAVFRIGGEEFVVLLSGACEADAIGVSEQIRNGISTSLRVPKATVTVSIGVSEIRSGDSPHTWLKRADDALYAAKHGGRNCVVGANQMRSKTH
jgi:diguanylate cyclase